MICRLCINNINERNAIVLFNYNENSVESNLVKMIAKHLQLELTQDDTVSTSICNECWTHLDDFDQFCKHVELKQANLRNEFLEIKCSNLLNDALAEEALIDNNDESLLDIKDVFIECETIISESATVEFGYANNAKEVADNDHISQSSTERKTSKRLTISKQKSKKEKKLPKYISKKRSSKRVKIESSSTLQTTNFNVQNKQKEIHSTSTDTTTKKVISSEVSNIENNSQESTTCTENEKAEKSEIFTATDTCKPLSKKYTAKESAENDKLISNNMRLKCELCEAPVETFAKLKGHFRSEHNCKGYVYCCGKRFLKRIGLVDHIRFHLNPNYYQCKICNKVLKSNICLDMHMRNIHPKDNDRNCECAVCGKKFPRQSILNAHNLTHKTERDFPCEHCDKAFFTKTMLKGHIKTVHDNISFFVCDFCGQKFKCKTSFERHVREHNGIFEEPVQCNICGEWLKHKNGLRQHLHKHVKINVECEFCGRVCHSKSTLKAHIRYTHQMQRNLQCTFCEKTFKSKSNLEEHIAMHTGEKRNQCPHCSREFRSKANMYVHIKKDHFDEWKIANSKAPLNTSFPQ